MSTLRFKLPAAVFLILTDQDRVLLIRRQNTGWHDGDYDLVAGHIDGRESLSQALSREAKEEMGIEILPKNTKFAVLSHALYEEDGKEYFNIFFTVSQWHGEPSIQEPDKCDDFRWFALDNLPPNLTPSAATGLGAVRSGTSYVEFGF
ncbi:MAG TPA: NUDIX domain-containing protein [Candidatus Saccharimonadia bacterium]|nr:NUDIX domain-containing protein [Candidatus Saccharimonadia bacterium]